MKLSVQLVARTPFYYGWIVVGAVALTMMLTGALAAPLFSIFIDPLTREFGWSRTAISAGFSIGSIAAALVGPLVGPILDRHGGRWVLFGGTLLMALSLVGLGFVTELIMFYAAFAVGRMAMMNISNLASHTVVANWFIERRALASAIVLNGSRLGLAFWPIVAGFVLVIAGWRQAFWVLGAALAVLSLVPLILVIARRPEEVGLSPDGNSVDSDSDLPDSLVTQRSLTVGQAVRTRVFWLLMFAHMTVMLVGAGVGVHRVPYYVGNGLSESWVGPLLTAWALGMALGGFLAAWLSKRVAAPRVVAISCLAGAAFIGLLLVVPLNGMTVLHAFGEGLAFGGIFAILPVVYADYFGRNAIGSIRGVTHPVVVASNAIGPLYAGFLFDVYGEYDLVFISFALVLLMGMIAAWSAINSPGIDSAPERRETLP